MEFNTATALADRLSKRDGGLAGETTFDKKSRLSKRHRIIVYNADRPVFLSNVIYMQRRAIAQKEGKKEGKIDRNNQRKKAKESRKESKKKGKSIDAEADK